MTAESCARAPQRDLFQGLQTCEKVKGLTLWQKRSIYFILRMYYGMYVCVYTHMYVNAYVCAPLCACVGGPKLTADGSHSPTYSRVSPSQLNQELTDQINRLLILPQESYLCHPKLRVQWANTASQLTHDF